jgi:hypothetical protein
MSKAGAVHDLRHDDDGEFSSSQARGGRYDENRFPGVMMLAGALAPTGGSYSSTALVVNTGIEEGVRDKSSARPQRVRCYRERITSF